MEGSEGMETVSNQKGQNMTPKQRVKWLILEKGRSWGGELPVITSENIDALYDEREEDWQDARDEVRCSGIETGIESKQWSRHYECEEVAAQCPDGKWVGWTYWHGGGKYGEPSEVEWIDDAYDVDVVEEEKVVTVRTFNRMAQP